MTAQTPKRLRIRGSRTSRRYRIAAALASMALLGAVAAMSVLEQRADDSAQTQEFIPSDTPFLTGFESLEASVDSGRSVYRHSVIPGGVYTPDELTNALAEDPLVAAHYQALEPSKVHTEIVQRDRLAYVSYRKDDRVYWTRNKVLVRAGETILTDGAQEIRARCGNRISATPMLPVAEVEPDQAELDRLVDETADDPYRPSVLAAGGPLAASAQPGPFAASSQPGPVMGNGPAGGFAGGPFAPGGAGTSAPAADDGRVVPLGFGGPPFGSPGPLGPGTGPGLGSPVPDGAPGPGGGGPFQEGPSGSPEPPPWIPPGIDLPPGFNPPLGFNPPPGYGPDPPYNPEAPDQPFNPVPVPEPGTLLLVGGGVAAVLLRKLRARR